MKITFDTNWELAINPGIGARHNPSGCTGYSGEDDDTVLIRNASVSDRSLARLGDLARKCETELEVKAMVMHEMDPCRRLGGRETLWVD